MQRSFSERLYADSRAPDGVFASGWRRVRKGGRVKAAGYWYQSDALKEIVGELIHVQIGDYWMGDILVSRGVVGCQDWFCNAEVEITAETPR